MTKVASPSVEIRPASVESAKAALGELVMAWARDIETGEPRYIGEIDADHRGGKCCCECPSCRLALIAVNAAKDKVIKRPHFRHPEGAQRDECAILAARAAAMRLLAEEGVIDLPRRRMSASAEGLSGAIHEAWIEAPAQKVRVASIDFRDRAFAMLTLDDGRKLRVALTGGITEQAGDDGGATLIPTITIDVDSSIAGMDQTEIRWRTGSRDALARNRRLAPRGRAVGRRRRACPPVRRRATASRCGSPHHLAQPCRALRRRRHRPVDRRDDCASAQFDAQLAGLCASRRGRCRQCGRRDDQRDERRCRGRRRRGRDEQVPREPTPLVHEIGVEPVRHRHARHRRSRVAFVQYSLLQLERVIAPRAPLCLLHGVHLVRWWTPSSAPAR